MKLRLKALLVIVNLLIPFQNCQPPAETTDNVPPTVLDFIHRSSINTTLYTIDFLRYAQRYGEAADEYARLLLSDKVELVPLERIYARQQRIRSLYLSGNVKEAFKELQQLEAQVVPDSMELGNQALYHLNRAYYELYKYRGDSALYHLKMADVLLQKTFSGDHILELEVFPLIVETTYRYAPKPEMIDYIHTETRRADALVKRNPEWKLLSKPYIRWKGHASFVQRTLDVGIDLLEEGVAASLQNSPWDTAFLIQCYGELSGLYKNESLGKAKTYAEDALKLAKEATMIDALTRQQAVRDYLTYAIYKENIKSESLNKRFWEEMDYLEAIIEKEGGKHFAYPLRLEGLYYFKKGEWDKAIKCYQNLLDELDNGDHFYNEYKMYDNSSNVLSLCYRAKGDWKQSNDWIVKNMTILTDYYEKAVYDFDQVMQGGYDQFNQHAFLLYSRLADNHVAEYEQTHNEIALQHALRLYEVADQLLFEHLTQKVTNKEALLQFGGEVNEAYYSSAVKACYYSSEIAPHKPYADTANYYMERTKAILLYREMLANGTAKSQLQQQFQAAEVIEDYLENEESTTVLQYDAGKFCTHAILRKKGKVVFKQMDIGQKEIEVATDSLIRLGKLFARSRNSENREKYWTNYRALSHELYQKILQPVAAYIGDKDQVLVVPDASLRLFPLEALYVNPDRKDGFLLNEYAWKIKYTPSFKTFSVKEEERNTIPARARLTYMGYNFSKVDNLPSGINRFDHAEDLRQHLIELYGADRVRSYFEETCTDEQLLRALAADNYDIFCAYMHADADEEDKYRNSLLLYATAAERQASGQEIVRVYDDQLAQLELYYPALIVFIACETAKGKIIKSEGTYSITRTLSQAGAGTIVSTLWKVDEAYMNEIVRSFFSELQTGKSVDEALYLAKWTYVQSRKKVSDINELHPIHWAGLVVFE
jgi:CHAT domain-containing protein